MTACHNLEELPDQLRLLKKLAYLDISECYLIDNMPKKLASLSELRVLKGFVISKSKQSCTLESLTALQKLKKLTIIVNSSQFLIDNQGKVLSTFAEVQKLRIAWGAEGSLVKSDAELNKAGRNGGKKGNGKEETGRRQRCLQKLKRPWGGCGKGSSNPVPEKKEENFQEENEQVKFKKLVKLDLQCFPSPEPPRWLVPANLTSLNSLYLSGGKLSYLRDIPVDKMKWEVKFLRLKYLDGVQISWKDLQTQFPKLKYLERVKCPGITCCPCNADGVWQQKP